MSGYSFTHVTITYIHGVVSFAPSQFPLLPLFYSPLYPFPLTWRLFAEARKLDILSAECGPSVVVCLGVHHAPHEGSQFTALLVAAPNLGGGDAVPTLGRGGAVAPLALALPASALRVALPVPRAAPSRAR